MTATQVLEQQEHARIIDEAVKRAADRLAKEIDFEVMTTALCSSGWTKIVLKPMTSEYGHAIDRWTAENCKGRYNTMGLVWVFQKPSDAVNFTLKWSN
jgi:hypothetical protein